jgi:hypothetical protein
MRLGMLAALLAIGCSGCATIPPPTQVSQATTVAPSWLECRDYSSPGTIGGSQQTLIGRACRQPDGSWRIDDGAASASQPGQVIAVPAPPAYFPYYPAYPYYAPWFWGPSFGLGASFVFGGHHHHHFHRRGFRRHILYQNDEQLTRVGA